MSLPPGPTMESFSRAVDQSNVLLTYLLRLTVVNDLQFSLEVGLGIWRTFRSSQNNIALILLPPIYTLRYENFFRINLKSIHTKSVKADDVEIETAICDNADAEVFPDHLRNIIAKSFKQNVARSFVRYMVDMYGPSRSVWHIWELPVLYYHKIMVIYYYPFLVVITLLFSCILFINDCICILTISPG